jgi:hypothetical protein
MFAGDEYFFHRVLHPHMCKIRPSQSQYKVVVNHLLLILPSLRHKLVLCHVVQKGFVEIVQHKAQPRGSCLTQHSQQQADHISKHNVLSELGKVYYQVVA